MSLKKMLMLASMALAAIAFSAPAMAQAEVVLTEEGVPLEIDAEVTATSEDLITQTAGGTLECDQVTLHFRLKENGGPTNHVLLDPLGEAGTEDCTVSGMFPTEIKDGTVLTPLTIDTWGTGHAGATFVSNVPAFGLTCHFIGLVHVQADENEGDTISVGQSVPGQPNLFGSGENCSTEGTMSGQFTLETSTGVPIEIDFVDTHAEETE